MILRKEFIYKNINFIKKMNFQMPYYNLPSYKYTPSTYQVNMVNSDTGLFVNSSMVFYCTEDVNWYLACVGNLSSFFKILVCYQHCVWKNKYEYEIQQGRYIYIQPPVKNVNPNSTPSIPTETKINSNHTTSGFNFHFDPPENINMVVNQNNLNSREDNDNIDNFTHNEKKTNFKNKKSGINSSIPNEYNTEYNTAYGETRVADEYNETGVANEYNNIRVADEYNDQYNDTEEEEEYNDQYNDTGVVEEYNDHYNDQYNDTGVVTEYNDEYHDSTYVKNDEVSIKSEIPDNDIHQLLNSIEDNFASTNFRETSTPPPVDNDHWDIIQNNDTFDSMTLEKYGRGYILKADKEHPDYGVKYFPSEENCRGWWQESNKGWFVRRENKNYFLERGALFLHHNSINNKKRQRF